MITITIVTAVKNARSTIDDAFRGLHGQDHQRTEHIVVDGGSVDGTLEVLERYRGRINKLITGPDSGLYDALNKGIRHATGDIVGILHADDLYADDHVLADVAGLFDRTGADSCYGDLLYVDRADPGRIRRYWRSGPFDRRRFLSGWMPPHPAFFVRRTVYEKYGLFNTDLGTAADYELMLRLLYKHGISTAYLPRVLVKMRTGGVSGRSLGNRLKAHGMDRKAWEVNGLKPYPWTLALKPLRKIVQYVARPG